MSAENLPSCLAFVLREEGGNVDDPQDPGGRTSRGVTQRVFNAWRTTHPGLHPDVWEAPQGTIEAIYREQYWVPYCDGLPAGLDLSFFDFSVNAGRTQATKTLQRALGIAADGMMGMVTRDAIAAAEPATLIRRYAELRESFYRGLAHFPRFGAGWLARTAHCRDAAIAMAMMAPLPTPRALPDDHASAKADPAAVSEPMVAPENGAVIGTGAATMTGMLAQLQEQLTPFAAMIRPVQYVLVAITVVAFGFTLHGFLHRSKVKEMVG